MSGSSTLGQASRSPLTKGLQLSLSKKAALVVLSLVAWGVFALGLISPLTPSYGLPSLSLFLAFFGVPFVVLVALTLRTPKRSLVRGMFVAQTLLIVLLELGLLLLQSGPPP